MMSACISAFGFLLHRPARGNVNCNQSGKPLIENVYYCAAYFQELNNNPRTGEYFHSSQYGNNENRAETETDIFSKHNKEHTSARQQQGAMRVTASSLFQ